MKAELPRTVLYLTTGILACLAQASAPPSGEPLFHGNEPLALELTAPFKILVKDRYGKSTYRPGELRYGEGDGMPASSEAAIVLPVELRTRGKTRRRKDHCAFPPLRIRFTPGSGDALFAGQRTVKLVTHCHDRDSFDQYVLQEYLAYRAYGQLTQRSHRVRLVRVTYVESGGRELTTRYGILLEDWKAVAARTGLQAADVDGAVNIAKLSADDANRVALFEYMIGNQDWSLLWPEPDEPCCHNVKPLLAPDGTVVPLPYDFDFSGMVNAPYALARHGSSNVRVRRYGGLCSTQGQLSSALQLFRDKRGAIYTLYREQPGMDAGRRRSALRYLDGFYRVIDDPDRVERQLIRRCRTD